jgi:hypothetical protein
VICNSLEIGEEATEGDGIQGLERRKCAIPKLG